MPGDIFNGPSWGDGGLLPSGGWRPGTQLNVPPRPLRQSIIWPKTSTEPQLRNPGSAPRGIQHAASPQGPVHTAPHRVGHSAPAPRIRLAISHLWGLTLDVIPLGGLP